MKGRTNVVWAVVSVGLGRPKGGGPRTRLRVLPLVAGVALAVSALVAGVGNASKPGTTLATFDIPGTYFWTVPKGVREVVFDVFGAVGGVNPALGVTYNSPGGMTTARFAVEAGQTFQIVVGGRGSDGVSSTPGAGGFNGGGDGSPGGDGSLGGGGGGGASDVRIGPTGISCESAYPCGDFARVVVAGGGGGNSTYRLGGYGGGLAGQSAFDGGDGGYPTFGGRCGSGNPGLTGCDGSFGVGGNGGDFGAGGGGGGWFGGGGGGRDGGGGGGSGFFSGFALGGSFSQPAAGGTGDGSVVVRTP